jgi:3-deoxy-D-manno-octulosonic-acid transferase
MSTPGKGQQAAASRAGPSLAWVVYNAIAVLLLPVILLYFLWRLVFRGKSLAGLSERLGGISERLRDLRGTQDQVIWIHAVSVGEVAAVAPILEQIRLAEPIARIVISTTTPTGREMVANRNLDPDALIYLPFDLPPVVEHVLDAVRPSVLVLVEKERWPNLLEAARRRGVRIAMVNAIVSDRTLRWAKLLRPLYRWVLSNVDVICAQSQIDADRLLAIGADPGRLLVTGNSKFDEDFPTVAEAEAAKFRQDFGFPQDAPVFVAGSTHEGEEDMVLQAFTRLRIEHGQLQLVIAPRHPERGGRVEQLVHEHGYRAYRRSRALEAGGADPLTPAPETDAQVCVAILDTIGELARVFAIASVTFVGNSLVPGGGHNLLQPIAQGKAALFGPHMANFRDIAAIAIREQVGIQVADVDGLAREADRLLKSDADLDLIAARGRRVVGKYAGASARCGERVVALLAQATR